ncbi:MAG: hypothetical protein IJ906_07670 [Oscillospiraceae bacterium]|nr:hypothetical protein [Oscillospiraceae bacterium]
MKAKLLPSGNYRVQVVAGFDEKGKRIVKSFTAETECEALRMADMFRQSQEELKDQNITVARAMQQYIDSRANVIEKTTLRSYHQIAECYFKSIHNVKLRSLKVMDVQRAVNLESARISPKTVKNAFGFLKFELPP